MEHRDQTPGFTSRTPCLQTLYEPERAASLLVSITDVMQQHRRVFAGRLFKQSDQSCWRPLSDLDRRETVHFIRPIPIRIGHHKSRVKVVRPAKLARQQERVVSHATDRRRKGRDDLDDPVQIVQALSGLKKLNQLNGGVDARTDRVLDAFTPGRIADNAWLIGPLGIEQRLGHVAFVNGIAGEKEV